MIDEDEPILKKAIGTDIERYPGNCLTQSILKKEAKEGIQKHKAYHGITKTEDCESFFKFFSPPQVPEDENDFYKHG
ncbi:unnamed protein product [Brassica rapa subsp. narinosa]